MNLIRKIAIYFIIILFLAILSVLFFVYYIYNIQKSSENLETLIDNKAQKFIKQSNSSALSIGIIKNDQEIIKGYGNLSKENKIKVNTKTLFEIASITKIFTASELQIMNDKGEISLNDPIEKYLQKKVNFKQPTGITLKQLATHTSGFPRLPNEILDILDKNPDNPYKNLQFKDIYNYLSNYSYNNTGKEDYDYSNFGMGLLGHIFELKTDKTYEEIIKKDIFDIVGMKYSGVLNNSFKSMLAQGYNEDGKKALFWENKSLAGAGALMSNSEDMMKFIKANLYENYSNISKSLQKCHIKQNTSSAETIGLGWNIKTGFTSKLMNTESLLWHNGATGGFSSFIALDKKNKIGLIILSNSSNGVDDLADELLKDIKIYTIY